MKRTDKPDPVPDIYAGDVGVLLATGPTLYKEHVEQIRPYHADGRLRVFGCNDAYKICDFLDVMYACDPKWWQANSDVLDHDFVKWTQDQLFASRNPGVNWVRGSGGKGLSTAENHIHFGGNSGFQLLNLAMHYGLRHIILLGYTMTVPPGHQQHFFGPHPKGLNQSTSSYRGFVSSFKSVQMKFRQIIVNCTPKSHLAKIFRDAELSDELTAIFDSDEHVIAAPKKLLGNKNERRNRKADAGGDKRPAKNDAGSKTDSAPVQRGNRNYRCDGSVS